MNMAREVSDLAEGSPDDAVHAFDGSAASYVMLRCCCCDPVIRRRRGGYCRWLPLPSCLKGE